MQKKLLHLAHSPDPDDAFMFWALAQNKMDSGNYEFKHILSDIQTLNERAKEGAYEISAISFHAYPSVCDRYALLPCGSSMGDNYGPMVVSKEERNGRSLSDITIAIPGKLTTAYLALQLYEPHLKTVVIPFDEIIDAVLEGKVDAGLIIHEGQLTYAQAGLKKWVDLGEWWFEKHQLPLPLGGNVIRRDLGKAAMSEINAILKKSIQMSLDHRKEAVEYSLQFGRGLDLGLADRFVGMYVNELTVDYGERGRKALRLLFDEAYEKGLLPKIELEFVE
ncbi:MAG: ABC transporter substrate-binding protein, partial [Deltaproteobacteria bacterium]|nr:ABC transporter substrate-binding protein [Deltaproteobacteria bacterium]